MPNTTRVVPSGAVSDPVTVSMRPAGPLFSADLMVDPQAGSLTRAGHVDWPEPRVLAVLLCLLRHAGSVVDKNRLIAEAWQDAVVSDHAINYAISRLRKLLDDDARQPRYIETLNKRGYRWLPSVSLQPLSTSAVDVDPAVEPALTALPITASPVEPPITSWRQRRYLLLTSATVLAIALIVWLSAGKKPGAELPSYPDRVRDTPSDSQSAYDQGRRELQQRTPASLAKAVNDFRRALATSADSALAWSGLADAYSLLSHYAPAADRAGHLQAAAEAADRAVALAPELAQAQASLGLVRLNQSDMTGAEAALSRAIALNPDYIEARHWLGELYFEAKRYDEAARQFAIALKQDPLNGVLQETAGLNEFDRGDLAAAERHFQTAVEVEPALSGGYRSLARAQYLRGDWTAAATNYRKAIALGYQRPTGLLDIAALQAQLGNDELAKRWQQAAVKDLDLSSFRLQEPLAQRRLTRDDWQHFAAFETDPALLAMAAYHRGEFALALQLYQQQVSPDELLSRRSIRLAGYSHAVYLAALLQAQAEIKPATALLDQLKALLDADQPSLRQYAGRAYVLAQWHALHDNAEAALLSLQEAFRLGYADLARLQQDPFLRKLQARYSSQHWFQQARQQLSEQQAALAPRLANWQPQASL